LKRLPSELWIERFAPGAAILGAIVMLTALYAFLSRALARGYGLLAMLLIALFAGANRCGDSNFVFDATILPASLAKIDRCSAAVTP
jgi:uncharacterized membrane-anchored protein